MSSGPKVKGSREYRLGYKQGLSKPSLVALKKGFSGNVLKKLKSEFEQRGGTKKALLGPWAIYGVLPKKTAQKVLKSDSDFFKGLKRGVKERTIKRDVAPRRAKKKAD